MPESIKNLIQPGDKLIYNRFNSQVLLLHEIAVLLNKMLNCDDADSLKEISGQIRQHYLSSAEAYRNNTAHLAKTFITPIDREAVHDLYIRLHAACRSLYLTSRSLSWLLMMAKDKYLIAMGQNLCKATEVLYELVHDIGCEGRRHVMKHAAQMHAIRREMDLTYDQALKKLYEEEAVPGKFIIRHEMLNALRDATEVCQEIAHTGENIVLTSMG